MIMYKFMKCSLWEGVRRGRVVRIKGIGVVAIASRTYPTHVYRRLPDRILRATEAAAVTF